jgi:hypothetical protein
MQKAATEWVNANVHSWSKQMSAVLFEEMPQLVQEAAEAVSRADPGAMKRVLPPNVWHVIDKITSRRGQVDCDLCQINPLGLLQIAWEETCKDPDSYRSLADVLTDIGDTCLQGDTHRLFFYVRAVRLSKLKNV